MAGLTLMGSVMPDKHFYFSIGAGVGSGLSYYVIQHKSQLEKEWRILRKVARKEIDWTLYFPIVIFVIGLWGLIPDIIHASGLLAKETTRTAVFNIFFLHSFFEYVEDAYPTIDRILNWVGQIILFSIAISSMVYYVHRVKALFHKNEHINESKQGN